MNVRLGPGTISGAGRAKQALEAEGAKRRVRAARAGKAAGEHRTKLRRARQRQAPLQRHIPETVLRVEWVAGDVPSTGEIAAAKGSTRPRLTAHMNHWDISLVPRR